MGIFQQSKFFYKIKSITCVKRLLNSFFLFFYLLKICWINERCLKCTFSVWKFPKKFPILRQILSFFLFRRVNGGRKGIIEKKKQTEIWIEQFEQIEQIERWKTVNPSCTRECNYFFSFWKYGFYILKLHLEHVTSTFSTFIS